MAGDKKRVLNTRPDGLDFRDRMYVPTLCEVPTARDLGLYRAAKVPILDQGSEGACTGFGLATVAHYLLRTRKDRPDDHEVSPHMFYDMARRYDEWAGVDYEGSSCRGAMKGWYKHGVCAGQFWEKSKTGIGTLSHTVVEDAANRPLGAYFRVNHKDLVAMHCAITEVGILYASATVHRGWENVHSDGVIAYDATPIGGHAFAIVAYDHDGFWIQNSWGKSWGADGFARISYRDWLDNGSDVWVARLAVPIALEVTKKSAGVSGIARAKPLSFSDIRPHVISIKNDGKLDEHGDIGTSKRSVEQIVRDDFPRITQGWNKKRLVLYAHGGLVGEEGALQTVSEYRRAMLDAECYPLAFIWKSDYWTTLKDMLEDATRRRRPEGFLDSAKDFMLDRLDDALEPIARVATGKAEWDEMKENALLATADKDGGARVLANLLAELPPDVEIHIVGHSAGSIFHAPLVQYLTASGVIADGPMKGAHGLERRISSCTLWAPACTTKLFKATYLPAIESGRIERFALFTLTDQVEQDDNCAGIYHKSLLYLVSNAFEATCRVPLVHPDGEPILGMEKFVHADQAIRALLANGHTSWIRSPNVDEPGSPNASRAMHHGDFDDDSCTVKATLARILGVSKMARELSFARSASSRQDIRRHINNSRAR